MPKFDRASLAKFLPGPKSISDFEKLNQTVDVDLPNSIDSSSSLAQQALTAANEALSQIEELAAQVEALQLLPVVIQETADDNLGPIAFNEDQFDYVGPVSSNP